MDEKIYTVPPMEFMTDIPEKLLKAIDVADVLNVSRAFAYRLMQQRKIPTVKIGGARRVRPVDLKEFIESCLDDPGNGAKDYPRQSNPSALPRYRIK